MRLFQFSPKQRTVLTWWMPGSGLEEKDAIVCDGAVRSGKTMAMGLSFFIWASTCFHGQRFGVCGKTIASLRRNVLAEVLPKLGELGASWREKRSENLLILRLFGHENRFYIFGGRDESSASLIQGVTFAGVLLDEVAPQVDTDGEFTLEISRQSGGEIFSKCQWETIKRSETPEGVHQVRLAKSWENRVVNGKTV